MSVVRTLVMTAVAGLLLAGCGGDNTPAAPTSSMTATPPSAVAASTPTAPASTPIARASTPAVKPTAPAADVLAEVTIKGGKISATGGTVVKAKAGQTVRVVATSDVADSLHVHGYDKTLELTPGKTVSLQFTADVKGSFEVETHESGKLAFRLQVS
ncbi:cupredoxin domain-containing protein [Kribbella sp. NPDC054772]